MSVPQITPLPPAPDRNDPDTIFHADADKFVRALPTFVEEANALAEHANLVIASNDGISRYQIQRFTPAAGATQLQLTAFSASNINELDVYRNGSWLDDVTYSPSTNTVGLPAASQTGDEYIVLRRIGAGRGISSIVGVGDGVEITYSDGTVGTVDGVFTEPLTLAQTSADTAVAARVAAEAARDAAAISETEAQEWAAHPEDVVVESGLYSARHYALKGAASAAAAATSETNADASADWAQLIADSIHIPGAASRKRTTTLAIGTGSTWTTAVDLPTENFADTDEWTWNATDKVFEQVRSVTERTIAYMRVEWEPNGTGSYRDARLQWVSPDGSQTVEVCRDRRPQGANVNITCVAAEMFVPPLGWRCRLQVRHDALTTQNVVLAQVTLERAMGRRGFDGSVVAAALSRASVTLAADSTTLTFPAEDISFAVGSAVYLVRNGVWQHKADYTVTAANTITLPYTALTGDVFEAILATGMKGDQGDPGEITVDPQAPPGRTLNSAFQPSADRPTWVSYTVEIACSASSAGAVSGTVELLSDLANPPTTRRCQAHSGFTALPSGDSFTHTARQQLAHLVPAGHYVLLSTSGGAITLVDQTETRL